MAHKDNSKQDLRSVLLRDGNVRSSTVVASTQHSKTDVKESQRLAIAARRAELQKNSKG